jgi:hypothetical protein
MANANLVVRVSAQIAEFQKSFNDATKVAKDFASDFEGIATRAAAVGTFFGGIAKDIAQSLASGFASAIRDAVKFSSEFSNAFIGLSSVARAFGTNTDAATSAAKRLSADGLLPLKDSATGLKNLLAAGFNLPQATKLMEAFKDSAAFGRQGALSFGDAVRSATEGVKNGNSILVDNAGVTKNLSQILKEAGFSAQDLSRASSDVSVRMALYNGILKETRAQTGDAAKLTQTYTGQLTGMRTSWTNLLATWGDAITKNATVAEGLGAVRDLFNKFNSVLSNNQRGYNLVSDAIIGFVKVLAGTVRAINFVQASFNGLDTIIAGATRGILGSLKTISDFLLKIITVAAKIPGSGIALSAFSNEISGLAIISGGAGTEIKTLTDRIAANDQRTKTWGANLSSAATTLDTLAGTLAETRGKTVELGAATDKLGESLGGPTGLPSKTKKAIDALDKIAAKVREVRELQPGDLLRNVSIPVAPPVLPSGPGVKSGGIDMGDFLHLAKPTIPPLFWQQLFPPKDIGLALGNAISAAIQGGGNVIQSAVGSLGQSFTTGFAKFLTTAKDLGGKGISGFLGGAIDAVLPGVGALLGPLVGKIGSAIKNAFGLGTAGRDLVKDFASSFGGFDALHKKLGDLGAAGERLWINLTQGVGRNNPEQAKAAIEAINAAFGRQADMLSKTQAVLDEYGITFEQTGEKFRNQTLATAFDALFEKTQILQEAGVDYSLILDKQASQYSELTAKAIATNTEIPSSMRPLLEKMAELGLLTDEATGEFIDLGKVKWAQTLTEGFKSVTDAINRLADALTTGVGGALDNLSQRRIKIPIEFDVGELPDGTVPHLAGGGIVRRRTLAIIGESGPEAIVPLTRSGMGLSAGGDSGGVFELQASQMRDFFNGEVVTVVRKDAARGGTVPRAGARRSY